LHTFILFESPESNLKELKPRVHTPFIGGEKSLWLLKNSLTRNLQKLDRVRKLYKRFFRVS
jgi:hypothetical protein